MSYGEYEAAKKRLWNDLLLKTYGTTDLRDQEHMQPDPEAHAFFAIVDAAFTPCDKMQGCVPVSRELVQYLAGWARDFSRGWEQRGGPFDTPRHNHFVSRAFNGFYETLTRAVKHGELRDYGQDRTMYGGLTLPQWFISQCIDELHEEALHCNKLWDESENWHETLRAPTSTSFLE